MDELKQLIRVLDADVRALREEVAGYREQETAKAVLIAKLTASTARQERMQRRNNFERFVLWVVVIGAIVGVTFYIHDRRATVKGQIASAHQETADLACFVYSYFISQHVSSDDGFLSALSDRYGCTDISHGSSGAPTPTPNPKPLRTPSAKPSKTPGVVGRGAVTTPRSPTQTVIIQKPGQTSTRTVVRSSPAPKPSSSSGPPPLLPLPIDLCGITLHLTC